MPPWLPQMCTVRPERAMPFLTCSNARSVKMANVLAKGTLPDDAMPAATSIMFCSAIPIENDLLGYSDLKWHDFVDLPKSASMTTTLGSPAIRSKPAPYPSLEAPPDEGALMTTPPGPFSTRRHSGPSHGMPDYPPCRRLPCPSLYWR